MQSTQRFTSRPRGYMGVPQPQGPMGDLQPPGPMTSSRSRNFSQRSLPIQIPNYYTLYICLNGMNSPEGQQLIYTRQITHVKQPPKVCWDDNFYGVFTRSGSLINTFNATVKDLNALRERYRLSSTTNQDITTELQIIKETQTIIHSIIIASGEESGFTVKVLATPTDLEAEIQSDERNAAAERDIYSTEWAGPVEV